MADTWLRAWNAMPPQKAVGALGVSGAHHAQFVLRSLQGRARGKTGRRQLPAGSTSFSECVPAMGGVEQTMDERELGRAIDRFLRTVPEKQCSLFLRRYWYAESISQIAARYSMKENTVKSVLFRTRAAARIFAEGGHHRMTNREQQEKYSAPSALWETT